MRVINFNTAKDLRKSDNGKQQILCKRSSARLFQFPKTVQESEYVIKTVSLGVVSQAGACVRPAHLARKPLRRIVARTPESWELRPGYFLTHYLDSLECGHQVVTYQFESAKKRRGCQECLDALAIPLKERIAA